MKNFLNKIKLFIVNHKILSIVIFIVVILIAYWAYGKITNTNGEILYVTTKVEKGTIIASISGTGQVSASTQIDLKPKASGNIVYLPVVNGQKVNTGTLIAQLDIKDAQKSVRDAEINLKSAKLSLEKLKIQNSSDNMNADLAKAYSDGFNNVSATFSDLPSTIIGIENILNKDILSDNSARIDGNVALNYRNLAETAYYAVKNAYNKNKSTFSTLNYNSKNTDLDSLISETYNTTALLSNAVKDLSDYVNYLSEDTGRTSDYISYQNTLSGYTNTTNTHLSNLLSTQTSIKNAKDAFPNTNLDIQSSELSLKQKENALQDAKDNLSNYFVYAPFGGTISNVAVKKTDSVNSGTTIATLITEQQIAELSLNEVDIAKIQIGQKTTLTFDAIPDLTITGKVAEINSVGTVSSGVVNYTVKISFDTSDVRIKPGMSVNATIITNVKQDVLMVPNSAVKSQNNMSYVETFTTALATPLTGKQGSPSLTPPGKKKVETGITNDTVTEITSGLNESDIVVVKKINGSTSTTKTTSTKNILSGMGGGPRN